MIYLGKFQKPERDEWGSALEALECALLLELQKMALEHNDQHVSCSIGAQKYP